MLVTLQVDEYFVKYFLSNPHQQLISNCSTNLLLTSFPLLFCLHRITGSSPFFYVKMKTILVLLALVMCVAAQHRQVSNAGDDASSFFILLIIIIIIITPLVVHYWTIIHTLLLSIFDRFASPPNSTQMSLPTDHPEWSSLPPAFGSPSLNKDKESM